MTNVDEILLDAIKIFIKNDLWELVKVFLPLIILALLGKGAILFVTKRKRTGRRRYSKNNDLRSIKGKFNLDNLESGIHFEEYIADLLLKLNYKKVKVLPSSSDYGTDILAELNGVTYAIQCKYYSKAVGIKAIQEIMGGKNHYNTHLAVVATNNGFTNNAIKLAESNKILLWDRKAIEKMISTAKKAWKEVIEKTKKTTF